MSSTWLETTANEECFQNRWLKHDVQIVRLQINDFFSKWFFFYRFFGLKKKKKKKTTDAIDDMRWSKVTRIRSRKWEKNMQSLNHDTRALTQAERKKTFINILHQRRTTVPGKVKFRKYHIPSFTIILHLYKRPIPVLYFCQRCLSLEISFESHSIISYLFAIIHVKQ